MDRAEARRRTIQRAIQRPEPPSIFQIARVSHEVRGDWCSCGEPANDCFWQIVLIPAHRAWRERYYSEVFG